MNCAFQCTRAVVFDNSKRKLSMDAVQRMTGCTHIMGGWVFNNNRHSPDYLQPCNWLVVNGQIRSRDQYNDWCFCVDQAGSPVMDNRKDHRYVLSGVPILKDRQKLYRKLTPDVARPAERQAVCWLSDGSMYIWCRKDILTRDQFQDRLLDLRAEGIDIVNALMMDGGGSVQGRGPGWKVKSSRILSTMICMWEGEKEETMRKKIVCLDAGHDAENLYNKSPDGSFYEHEFTLDIAKRVQNILEEAGVGVVMTRNGGEEVSLAQRCQCANAAKANLFVSLHTNADAGSGWSSARGWEVYHHHTSKAGKALATHIAKAVSDGGVLMRTPGIRPQNYYVLRNTKAPAILIEHGFHTNQSDVALMRQNSYRQMLAQAEAQGILDYLGINVPKPEQPVPPVEPEKPQEPSEDDLAVQWALDKGIIQGDAQGDLGLDQPVSKMAVLRMMYRVMSQ